MDKPTHILRVAQADLSHWFHPQSAQVHIVTQLRCEDMLGLLGYLSSIFGFSFKSEFSGWQISQVKSGSEPTTKLHVSFSSGDISCSPLGWDNYVTSDGTPTGTPQLRIRGNNYPGNNYSEAAVWRALPAAHDWGYHSVGNGGKMYRWWALQAVTHDGLGTKVLETL